VVRFRQRRFVFGKKRRGNRFSGSGGRGRGGLIFKVGALNLHRTCWFSD